ncbi:hypothetical protein [Salirhabdus sp. Marseille-P4669]|uniref:hypothetical protein n=1 Tax=Salirhabdus sp. Marseille-P4669 TaxID=2042310 RepID=UPI000C7E2524|nr:hypothetical protein [Salirhabdus sp. Marseille-P4669]
MVGIIAFLFYAGGIIIGLFVLYMVIESAVRNGINNSVIGQRFTQKQDIMEDKKSFLDNDLDD